MRRLLHSNLYRYKNLIFCVKQLDTVCRLLKKSYLQAITNSSSVKLIYLSVYVTGLYVGNGLIKISFGPPTLDDLANRYIPHAWG